MSITAVRRTIYLATGMAALLAIVLVPGLIAPRQMASLVDRFPKGVARWLRPVTAPCGAPARVDLDEVSRALRPRIDAIAGEPAVAGYGEIVAVITGERPALLLEDPPPAVKVLMTFARTGAPDGGSCAVLRLAGVRGRRIVAVGRGDAIEEMNATVKEILKDEVVLIRQGRETRIRREDSEAEYRPGVEG